MCLARWIQQYERNNMIAEHKEIIIHVEYDPNLPPDPNVGIAVDAVTTVIEGLHFKEVITRKLQQALTPEQFKKIYVIVK